MQGKRNNLRLLLDNPRPEFLASVLLQRSKCSKETLLSHRPLARIKYILSSIADDCLRKGKLIIKTSRFLEWREWVNIYDEDLLICASRHAKKKYMQGASLELGSLALKSALAKKATDIHFHLNGSGDFSIFNWLELHNNCALLSVEDDWRFKAYLSRDESDLVAFNRRCVLLRGIRWYLYRSVSSLHNVVEETNKLQDLLSAYLNGYGIDLMLPYAPLISEITNKCRGTVYDYAESLMCCSELPTPHTGERLLLSKCFQKFTKAQLSKGETFDALALWLYLVLRRWFFSFFKVSQQGFDQFIARFRTSRLFGNKDTNQRLIQQMIRELENDGFVRAVEFRVSANKNPLRPIRNMERSFLSLSIQNMSVSWSRGYIIHFLKKPVEQDELAIDRRPMGYLESAKKIVRSISKLEIREAKMFCGIDAAGDERLCPPEVFGPAYRFLKREFASLRVERGGEGHKLGRTYHVGEVFDDLLTGLRRIWESIVFLELEAGDRLGHALALGVKPEDYYGGIDKFNCTFGEFVDNAVWALKLFGQHICQDADLRSFLDCLVPNYFSEKTDSLNEYWGSMLLRSDLQTMWDLPMPKSVSDNDQSPLCLAATSNRDVKQIRAQFFDANKAKSNAPTFAELGINKNELVRIVSSIQNAIMDELKRKGIIIEANPTSNRCICPSIHRFEDLPLFAFLKHKLSIAISTDDQGIFGTNLYTEYCIAKNAGGLNTSELVNMATFSSDASFLQM